MSLIWETAPGGKTGLSQRPDEAKVMAKPAEHARAEESCYCLLS